MTRWRDQRWVPGNRASAAPALPPPSRQRWASARATLARRVGQPGGQGCCVQMLQIERDLIEKEQEDESKEAKPDSKADFCRRMPSIHKGQDHKVQDQTKALLPDVWRTQVVHSLLRLRRREQLQLLQEWRMDMATYNWEVQEWRRERSALTCPVMPPYPTHVPSSKELARVIIEARRICKTGAPPPVSFSTVHKSEVEGTGLEWYPKEADKGLHQEKLEMMEEVIEPLVTPKGSVLEPELVL
ncbi:unnamed protein product [Symbiodinium natans]|uniref:Uncharacterized protein n=1 Tax=Symbiodinium natans TaxID=878477 RepID=A0A812NR72_9DINO|nr:unnamed protein product [Symbiodinium natans]